MYSDDTSGARCKYKTGRHNQDRSRRATNHRRILTRPVLIVATGLGFATCPRSAHTHTHTHTHTVFHVNNFRTMYTAYKIGGKLVLITNRKSHISFRLIPKSVTLNHLERRNGRYFALFHRICVRCRRKIITSVSKSTFENL